MKKWLFIWLFPLLGWAAQVQQIDEKGYEEIALKAKGPVVVNFYANWCLSCRKMKPIVEELANEYEGK